MFVVVAAGRTLPHPFNTLAAARRAREELVDEGVRDVRVRPYRGTRRPHG